MSFDSQQPVDTAIRDAIASGRHADAFALVHRAYGGAVYRLAQRMVRDTTLAQDVVQEALPRIHRGLGTMRSGTNVGAWVMAVATHRGLDELRSRNRRRRRIADDNGDLADVADRSPTPAEALATSREMRVLHECLATLPPKVRASVALYFGGELTFNEVATILGESGGTVQVRVKRAMTRLRTQLQRRDVRQARSVATASTAGVSPTHGRAKDRS